MDYHVRFIQHPSLAEPIVSNFYLPQFADIYEEVLRQSLARVESIVGSDLTYLHNVTFITSEAEILPSGGYSYLDSQVKLYINDTMLSIMLSGRSPEDEMVTIAGYIKDLAAGKGLNLEQLAFIRQKTADYLSFVRSGEQDYFFSIMLELVTHELLHVYLTNLAGRSGLSMHPPEEDFSYFILIDEKREKMERGYKKLLREGDYRNLEIMNRSFMKWLLRIADDNAESVLEDAYNIGLQEVIIRLLALKNGLTASPKDLQSIITDLYENEGYVLAGCWIPDRQEFEQVSAILSLDELIEYYKNKLTHEAYLEFAIGFNLEI